ncbi:hypothetical protein niasHS_016572 [Heterodera schachtii]|uniref:polynucleotide adenylyltransferase n=1 Tax=Heterodera schachtii TaxID=97005 RepID=A0ABD2HTP2_HETSC
MQTSSNLLIRMEFMDLFTRPRISRRSVDHHSMLHRFGRNRALLKRMGRMPYQDNFYLGNHQEIQLHQGIHQEIHLHQEMHQEIHLHQEMHQEIHLHQEIHQLRRIGQAFLADNPSSRRELHPEVHSLQRIQSNWVPLIRLKVINFDHEIDIVFASIPGEQQIDADDLRQQNILTKFEEMIEKLDNKIKQLKEEEDRNDQASLTNAKEQMLKSLRSLAGYHSNLKLLEMVKKNNNFHKLLLVLKLWAKSNYIYNNAMGFFNGTSLGVLAAKIVLLYPEATVPFLLERFFFTYSSWEWPLPVQIAEIRPNSSLNWNAWDEQNHLLSQYGSGGAYSKLMIPTWLVGVKKMNDTQIKRQQGQVGGDLQQNDNKLKQELDEVIVNSYKSIVLRGGRRGGANLNLAEQKIQKHFARNNLFQGTDETDNQRDFVNLESKYVDKQIHSS